MLSVTNPSKNPPRNDGFPWGLAFLIVLGGVALAYVAADGNPSQEFLAGALAIVGAVVLIGLPAAAIFALYFIPTIAAVVRGHRPTLAIGMLDTLAGWTFIGWVAALVWTRAQDP